MAKNATLEKPRASTKPAPAAPKKSPSVIDTTPVTAFAIVKKTNGENLWQLVTYTIQGDNIVHVDRSVEDLREILVAKIPDMIGGLL